MLKFCKQCGTLYTTSLGVCPKCGTKEAEERAREAEIASAPAEKGSVRRDWLFIVIGVPLFIAFLYAAVWLFRLLTAR